MPSAPTQREIQSFKSDRTYETSECKSKDIEDEGSNFDESDESIDSYFDIEWYDTAGHN